MGVIHFVNRPRVPPAQPIDDPGLSRVVESEKGSVEVAHGHRVGRLDVGARTKTIRSIGPPMRQNAQGIVGWTTHTGKPSVQHTHDRGCRWIVERHLLALYLQGGSKLQSPRGRSA